MRSPVLGVVSHVQRAEAAAPVLRALFDRCHVVAWHPGLPVDAIFATSWRAPRLREAPARPATGSCCGVTPSTPRLLSGASALPSSLPPPIRQSTHGTTGPSRRSCVSAGAAGSASTCPSRCPMACRGGSSAHSSRCAPRSLRPERPRSRRLRSPLPSSPTRRPPGCWRAPTASTCASATAIRQVRPRWRVRSARTIEQPRRSGTPAGGWSRSTTT